MNSVRTIAMTASITTALLLGVGMGRWSSPEAAGAHDEDGVVNWLASTPGLAPEIRRSVLIDRIATHPGDIDAILASIKSATTQPSFEDVATDLVLLDSTERALGSCKTTGQANALVSARSTIQMRMDDTIESIAQRLIDDGKAFGGDPSKALAAEPWASEVDRLRSLAEQAEVTPSPVSPITAGVVSDVVQQASDCLVHVRAFVTDLRPKVMEEAIIEAKAQIVSLPSSRSSPVSTRCQHGGWSGRRLVHGRPSTPTAAWPVRLCGPWRCPIHRRIAQAVAAYAEDFGHYAAARLEAFAHRQAQTHSRRR